METIAVNTAGKVRRVVEGGKEYLVADATLICPGVLNGSKGPLYYPPDEVAKTAAAWNGMPLTVYHPTDPLTGQHLSARDHGVLERQGIGNVRSPVVVADGKLRAKLWFDADRTRAVDWRVYDALVKGQAVELSTGLFTTNMPAPTGAHHKGQPYSHVATAYVPDHLAILPDQRGACSINDGCGVLVNAAQTRGVVARFWDWLTGNAGANQPRHGDTGQFLPTGAGTGKGPAHAAAKEGHAHTGFTDPEKDKPGGDDDDADSGMKTKGSKGGGGKGNKIVGLDDNGNPITNDGSTSEQSAPATVTPGQGVKPPKPPKPLKAALSGSAEAQTRKEQGADALSAALGTRNAGEPMDPHEATLAAVGATHKAGGQRAQNNALTALGHSNNDNPDAAAGSHEKAAVAHEKMATKSRMAGDHDDAEDHDDAAALHRKAASCQRAGSMAENRRATRNAFDSDEQRKAFFGLLAAHKGSEGEKKTNAATEASDKATSIASPVGGGKKAEAEHKGKVRAAHDEAAEAHDEAAVHHEKNGNKELASLHRETAKHHRSEASTNNRAGTMNRAAVIDHLIVNGCACEADRVALNALSDRVLNAFKRKADDDDDEEDDDDEDDRFPRRNDGTDIHSFDGKGTKSGGSQQSGGKGTKEEYAENRWLQSAPPGIQRMVANYKAAENRERVNLVNQLIANVDDDARRKAIANRLLRKDVDELRDLVAIMGPRVGPEPSLSALYLGSAAPIGNADQQAADQNDILPLPTLNWEEVSREHRSKKA